MNRGNRRKRRKGEKKREQGRRKYEDEGIGKRKNRGKMK